MHTLTHLHRHKTGAAGRPTKHCLYAVFDLEEDARQAERALAERNIEVRRPNWMERAWNHSLHTMDEHGFMGALHDILQELRAELYELEHYVNHSAQGRVVLVVCGADHAKAEQAIPLLTRYGGYDITYFGDWAVTYVSPAERGSLVAEPDMASARPARAMPS